MFLCHDCHSPECGLEDLHPLSGGACEGCGAYAKCLDCGFKRKPTPPPPTKATRLDLIDADSWRHEAITLDDKGRQVKVTKRMLRLPDGRLVMETITEALN